MQLVASLSNNRQQAEIDFVCTACTYLSTSWNKLAFLTPCDQAFNPPFLGGKIIQLAKFCFKNKRFEPSLSFFSKQVIVSHCV